MMLDYHTELFYQNMLRSASHITAVMTGFSSGLAL